MNKMNDLISRSAAIDYLMTNMGWHDEDGYEVDDADEKRDIITDLVNGIPTVDAVLVVHGWWTDDECCSECGQYVYQGDMRNYCPCCGAKMDLEDIIR